jgi:hypothetical protein
MHAHSRYDSASLREQAALLERFHADLTTVLRSYQSALSYALCIFTSTQWEGSGVVDPDSKDY